jgi:hypothetical protein
MIPFSFTTKARIKNLLKAGQTQDGRVVLRLSVTVDNTDYILNIVGKEGLNAEEMVKELVKLKVITKEGDEWVIEIPTWSMAKARNAMIWVHWEDYERLKGSKTMASA